MNDILDASLQLSSTSTPKTFAIACWLSMRLPFCGSALNTTFRPFPLGVTYTSKISDNNSLFLSDDNSDNFDNSFSVSSAD